MNNELNAELNAELIEASRKVAQINELELDKECIRLPSDFIKFSHLAAEKRAAMDDRKAALELCEAQLGMQVRNTPGKFGLEKVTESAISAVVLGQPKYQKADRRFRSAKHQLDIVSATCSALEHKKRSLTLLVELHGMSYFASPRMSAAGRQAVDDMTKEGVRPRRSAMQKKREDNAE